MAEHWTVEAEWRCHAVYRLALAEAAEVARVHGLTTITLSGIGHPAGEHTAVALVEREIRGLLADYDRRTGERT